MVGVGGGALIVHRGSMRTQAASSAPGKTTKKKAFVLVCECLPSDGRGDELRVSAAPARLCLN